MTFLLKIAFYALLCICSLISLFFLTAALFDNKPGSNLREKVSLTLAAVSALGLLYWAFRLGHQQGQWGYGLGVIVLAALAFGLIMLIGMLTAKNIHWQ